MSEPMPPVHIETSENGNNVYVSLGNYDRYTKILSAKPPALTLRWRTKLAIKSLKYDWMYNTEILPERRRKISNRLKDLEDEG